MTTNSSLLGGHIVLSIVWLKIYSFGAIQPQISITFCPTSTKLHQTTKFVLDLL